MATSDDPKGRKPRYRGALDSHLADIRKYALLTESGEFRVASASRRGEEKARNQLVQANLRLVVSVAKTFQSATCDLGELIAEGHVGLIEAANRFDPSRGVRFVAYAPYWIRKYMLLALRRNARQTSSPEDSPAPGEAPARRRRLVSLEEFVLDTGDRPFLETLALETAHRADEVVFEQELAAALRALLPKLAPRERTILAAHFGLDGAVLRTLQQIGETLGLTRERVRQLERRALGRARRLLLQGRR